eukprot:10428962-Karenia_brevis.AAC.1
MVQGDFNCLAPGEQAHLMDPWAHALAHGSPTAGSVGFQSTDHAIDDDNDEFSDDADDFHNSDDDGDNDTHDYFGMVNPVGDGAAGARGRRRHSQGEKIWRECLAQLLELMQTGPTRYDSHKKAEARLDR